MNKKYFLTAAIASTIFLSGCFGPSEGVQKGAELYEAGDEQSLLKAQEFFLAYLEKNPGDNEAEKYIEKIELKYVEVGKAEVDRLYSKGDIVGAYEIMKNLAAIAPNDKDIQDAFKDIEKLHGEQIAYDDFATHLEDAYKRTYETYTNWDQVISDGIVGRYTVPEVIAQSRITLEQISTIRKSVEEKNLQVSEPQFAAANSIIFDFLNIAESNFARVASSTSPEIQMLEIRDRTNVFSPDQFNKHFTSVKESMDYYVNETDQDGKPLRTITNTLLFDYEAIKKEQEKELKKKEAEKSAKATEESAAPADEK